jgi:hypothetical protein
MKLTWRDGLGTLVTGAGLLAAGAALAGWGWPLMTDARAGVITLLVMALVVCPLGLGNPSAGWYRDPFVLAAMVLGTSILAIGVVGLMTSPAATLPWMMGLTAVTWIATTADHALGPVGRIRATSA